MPAFKDLTGQQFGRLTVLAFEQLNRHGQSLWKVRCKCGKEKTLRGYTLTSGHTQSCGCLRMERSTAATRLANMTHGMYDTPTYRSWHAMKSRCMNPRATGFRNYGGRGISVCDAWMLFENFVADMGIRPENTELDRIDNDGNYEPGNVRWVSRKKNLRNTRINRSISIGGVTRCIADWAVHVGISRKTIEQRLRRGWTEREAVFGR